MRQDDSEASVFFEFGRQVDVKLGEWVEASFLLTNVGDQPLRILEKPYIEVMEGC